MSGYDPEYARQYRKDAAQGKRRRTSAAPAIAHIKALLAAGCTVRGIADVSGLSAALISGISRSQDRRIGHGIEETILAVRPEQIFARPNAKGFVPAAGARRRIQALLRLGWRYSDMDQVMGIPTALVPHQKGSMVTRRKHEAIVAGYEKLWDRPGPSPKTARLAAKAGYALPLDWDDDEIDNPAAKPHQGEGSRTAGLIEDAEFLAAQGLTLAEVAQRLGYADKSGVEVLIRRNNLHALKAQLEKNRARAEYGQAA